MLNECFLSRNLSSVSWGLLTPLLGELIYSPDLARFSWIHHVSLGCKAEMQIKLTRQKGVYWLVTQKSPRIVFAPSTSGSRSTCQDFISLVLQMYTYVYIYMWVYHCSFLKICFFLHWLLFLYMLSSCSSETVASSSKSEIVFALSVSGSRSTNQELI